MQRKVHGAEFKAKVVLEALKEQKTINEIAAVFKVHPTQVSQWKRQALDELSQLFSQKRGRQVKEQEELKMALYQEIGQLKFELDWVKKKWESSLETKRGLVEADHSRLTVQRQCQRLGLKRSTAYYQAREERAVHLVLKHRLDELYTAWPFYGTRRMTAYLQQEGHAVNRKRVQRLMREMGLEAIYPKRSLSQPMPGHRIYPYLLRDCTIARPNQVWSTDITYIRLSQGFLYLVAIMDWYSRYVLSWRLSNSLDSRFCLESLDQSLEQTKPEIFNTDQGSQFTSLEFTGRLEQAEIRISMDGRGRALDNVFVERLWRTVKYEEVYLKGYQTVPEARNSLDCYFQFYNHQRLHQALDYRTPHQIYSESVALGSKGEKS
jgi:putative transposase